MNPDDLVREINRSLYPPTQWRTTRDNAQALVKILDAGHSPPTVPVNWDLVEAAEEGDNPAARTALVFLAMLALDLPPDPSTSAA